MSQQFGSAYEEPLRPANVLDAYSPSRSEGGSNKSSGLFGRRIRLTALIQLLRRVGQSIHAGIDVRRIWETEKNRCPATHRGYFDEINRRVSRGDSLAEAMTGLGSYFPGLVCEMVDVGERTGKLDQVLLRLADHYEHLQKLRRNFIVGITWPAIQLTVAVGVIGLLIWIVGMIADMRGGEPIDILGLGLVGNRGLLIYSVLVGTVVSAFSGFIYAARQGMFGSAPIRMAMKIPLIGGVLRTNALATLTWTLSMALEAGVDARQSIRMALRSTQVPHYLALVTPVDNSILRGTEFHEALRNTGEFPADFLDALETAEISGRLSESMIQLSNDYTQRAQIANQTLIMFATFGIWGCVAALIIFLIFRLFFFYLGQLNEALNGI